MTGSSEITNVDNQENTKRELTLYVKLKSLLDQFSTTAS
jgi:hypothetical protein